MRFNGRVSSVSHRLLALLFTDIEGSTRHAQRLGSEWRDVLRQQREISRVSWQGHSGFEVDTAGDGFFVTFERVLEAVHAAVEVQQAMTAATWPGDAPIRVRMGLHVGDVVAYDGSFIGYDVHRAARISAAAHGGQLLASGTVAAAFDDQPDDLEITDLGTHALKDLAEDERLFQIRADGMLTDFPKVRSLGVADAGFPELARTLLRPDAVASAALRLDDGRKIIVTEQGARIGRQPDNDLVLSEPSTSRHHCVITAAKDGFVLTDLQSTHGTSVNQTRVTEPQLLDDGDELMVGKTHMVFVWPS